MGNRPTKSMRNMRLIIIAFIYVAFAVFLSYISGYKGTATAEAAGSCVTDKCHANMGKDKFVHGPAAVGQCEICHISDGPFKVVGGKHGKFKSIDKASDLCYKCHDKLDSKKSVHSPVKDGFCTMCHNPHQSPYKFMLMGDGQELCFMCHDKAMVSGKFVHSPVAAGECLMCHNPHQADFPRMLSADGNEVCFSCHADKAEAFKSRKFIHKPVQEKCVNCHSPHSGNSKFNLKTEGSQDLCLGCHTDKKDWIANVKVKHGGLSSDRKCLACHDPHVSDYPKQLAKKPVDTCFICHDKDYKESDGKVRTMNMLDYLAKNKDHHGPIRQGDCSSCHNTHGSDNFRILRKYFPPVFYAPFDPKNYDLCFSCHEKTLVLEEKTTTLTGFRNGDKNLHYVHVNKTVKGRTCRACHDAHATNNPRHIRDSVPFGEWGLPVGFKKTDNGGSCLPGCHRKFEYNRVSPIKNK